MFLLDASVWIASKDASDRYCSAARPLVLDADLPVSALDLTFYEVANVVGTRWREFDAARRLVRTIASRCGDQLVRADSDLLESALEVAAEHGLAAYDAAYVAAARRGGMTLVSADIVDLVSKGLAVAPDDADYP